MPRLSVPIKKQATDTGILLALLATVAGVYTGQSRYFIFTAAVLLVLLVYPGVFRLPALLWFGFARLLSRFMSRILLSIIYCVLVLPVGLLRRAGGHDRLRLRQFDKGISSTWENRNHVFQSDDLTHIF